MKNFDEKIRDKLFDAEMPVSDHVWDFIESQITEKNQRPKYWFFFVASLIVLPISLIGFYVNFNSTNSEIYNNNELQVDLEQIAEAQELVPNSELNYLPNLSTHNHSQKLNTLERSSLNLGFQISRIGLNNHSLTESDFMDSPIDELVQIDVNFNTNQNSLEKINSLIFNIENKDFISENLGLFLAKPQCPQFNRKLDGYYLYGSIGTYYPFQLLSGDDIESNEYISSRNATETGTLSYSFDIGMGYEHINGLFAQAGIKYDRLNFNFIHEKEYVERNVEKITRDSVFNSEGQFLEIKTDTSINQILGIERTTSLNTFTQVDIPFSVGYKMPIGRDLKVSVNAGFVVNLSTTQKGKILDINNQPRSIFDLDGVDKIYKERVGLSYTGGVVLEKQFNDNLFFNAGIDLRYYGGRFNEETNKIGHRFFKAGLTAGVRYRI